MTETNLFVNMFPCCEFTKAILQSGIAEVNIIEWKEDKEFEERWAKSIELAKMMFKESGVDVDKWTWIEERKEFGLYRVVWNEGYDPLPAIIAEHTRFGDYNG